MEHGLCCEEQTSSSNREFYSSLYTLNANYNVPHRKPIVPTLRQIIPTTISQLILKMLFNIIFRSYVLPFTFYSQKPVLLYLSHVLHDRPISFVTLPLG